MTDMNRRVLPWLLLPLGAFLVFILPWYIPQSIPIVSDSYTFGFSNFTAHVGVAILLAVLLALRWTGENKTRLALRGAAAPEAEDSRLPLLATVAAASLSVGIVGGWWLYLPKAYFAESTYFMARLDRMLMGQKPYRDFEYGYGPWALDAPFLLHRLAPWIAIDTSYILCLLGSFVLGILLLASVVRSLEISDRLKAGLIFCFGFAGINLSMGIIYTPLRYLFPLWAIIRFHRRVRQDAALGHALSLRQMLAAFLLPLAAFGICPDTGVVTFLGILAGCFWRRRRGFRGGPEVCALAAAGALWVVGALYGKDYFKMLFLFGGGAYNFPIFPAPYILIFLACVFYLLPEIGARALEKDRPEAPLHASLLVVLGLFIPSALGRCDPGHVFWSGYGIFLLTAAGLWTPSARGAPQTLRRRLACVCGALVFYITLQVTSWRNGKPEMLYVIQLKQDMRRDPASFEAPWKEVAERVAADPARRSYGWSKRTPASDWFVALLRYDRVGLPLGSGEDVDRFLKSCGRYIPEFSVAPFGGTFDLESLRRKLAALSGMNTILVPRIYFRNLRPLDPAEYSKSTCELMQSLFLFPVNLSMVNAPLIPERVVIRRIALDYVLKVKFRDYVVLQRAHPL